MRVPLFWNLETPRPEKVYWDTEVANNALFCGSTGTGKTVAILLTLGKISLGFPDTTIIVIDYKGLDYEFLNGCSRGYYKYSEAFDGLTNFYNVLQRRQSGEDKSRSAYICVVDELASWLNSLDKKQSEAVRSMISNIAALSRAFNMSLLVGTQRPDAEYFGKSRDNFQFLVTLGNLSAEAKQMFFSSTLRDEMEPVRGKGAGYLLVNGADMTKIQVPKIGNFTYLHEVIRRCVVK